MSNELTSGSTLIVEFETSGTGGPTAPSVVFVPGDFRIYRKGETTARVGTSGVTVVTSKDGQPGLHEIAINTDNQTSDPGFYVADQEYYVVANATVSGAEVEGSVVSGLLPRSDFKIVASPAATAALANSIFDQIETLINEADTTTAVAAIQTAVDALPALSSIANAILANPTNPITTDATGQVTTANPTEPTDLTAIAASLAALGIAIETTLKKDQQYNLALDPNNTQASQADVTFTEIAQ